MGPSGVDGGGVVHGWQRGDELGREVEGAGPGLPCPVLLWVMQGSGDTARLGCNGHSR